MSLEAFSANTDLKEVTKGIIKESRVFNGGRACRYWMLIGQPT